MRSPDSTPGDGLSYASASVLAGGRTIVGRRQIRLASAFSRLRTKLFPSVASDGQDPPSPAAFAQQLVTEDETLAAEILDEALSAYDRTWQRIESAERRAATLQGATAIAAGFTLSSAALLVDSKFRGLAWSALFFVGFAWFLLSLVACGWRATQATARLHVYALPGTHESLPPNGHSAAFFRIGRAGELLAANAVNEEIAQFKILMLRAAAGWLVTALGSLLAVLVLAGVYAIAHAAG
jgi:hypothetical protein